MTQELRVTTNAAYYEEHAYSLELYARPETLYLHHQRSLRPPRSSNRTSR